MKLKRIFLDVPSGIETKLPRHKTFKELCRDLWAELHTKPDATPEWFEEWLRRIPQFGCTCAEDFAEILKRFPPQYGPGWFPWTVSVHNEVNAKLTREDALRLQFTLAEAYDRWWCKGEHESTTPSFTYEVDAINARLCR